MTSPNGMPGSSAELEQLTSLLPGDSLEIWGSGTLVVKTALICQETVEDETTTWHWLFLDDGSLLEASPDGYFRYDRHQVHKQGTGLYEELVAQDGALVRFEERVRAGQSGRRPVGVTIDGTEYRISGTGTVRIQRLGEDCTLAPWQTIGKDADDHVYFGMVATSDDSSVGLGLWTQHLCLSFGKELGETDVTAVYKQKN